MPHEDVQKKYLKKKKKKEEEEEEEEIPNRKDLADNTSDSCSH